MDEDELECNPDVLLCDPGARPPALMSPAPAMEPTPADPALDGASADLMGRPPGWGVLLDPEPEHHPPDADLGDWRMQTAPAPAPAPTPTPTPRPPIQRPRSTAPSPAPRPAPAAPSGSSETPAANPDWVVDEQLGEHGPYLHYEEPSNTGTHRDAGGVFETGLIDDASTGEGDSADLSVVNLSGGYGAWQDRQGHRNFGVHLGAESGRVGFNTDHGDIADHERMSFGGPAADLSIMANEETATLGLQAAVGDVAVEGGTGAHADRDDDSSWSGGLSEGPGAALRIHYGDADHDGIPEMGLGADIGPFAGNYRSEGIGRRVTEFRDSHPGVASAVNGAWNWAFGDEHWDF